MFKIPTLWHPLKLLSLIAALFMFAFQTIGSKTVLGFAKMVTTVGPALLFGISLLLMSLAPELPPQMTGPTFWLSNITGVIFGGYLLFKQLNAAKKASDQQRLAFGQMRM